VTIEERLRRAGSVVLVCLVALPIGAVVHRISGALEVDRSTWVTIALATVGTAVLTFCFPRWRRFPVRPGGAADWPRTPVQKALFVVLVTVLLVAMVVLGYFRMAD
jgi:hypothetical protein